MVLPVFAIVACGFGAGRYGVVGKDGARSLNNYVYYVALPALLFLSLASAPVDKVANWGFLWANLGGILVSFMAAIAVSRALFGRRLPDSSIDGMSASYGTTGYMGIPLLVAAFGSGAALPAALATLIHNIPVIAAVTFAFEASNVSSKEKGDDRFVALLSVALKAVRPVLLNPLTISVLAGGIVAGAGISLPQAVDTFTGLLANAAGPTALFAIGLSLANQGGLLEAETFLTSSLWTTVSFKLFLQPAVTALLALYVFELKGLWAASAIMMSALPVGAGAYIFAQRYRSAVEQTSLAVLVSMILSVVTVSVVLVLTQAYLVS